MHFVFMLFPWSQLTAAASKSLCGDSDVWVILGFIGCLFQVLYVQLLWTGSWMSAKSPAEPLLCSLHRWRLSAHNQHGSVLAAAVSPALGGVF